MSQNPYSSPNYSQAPPQYQAPQPMGPNIGMGNQVRVLSIMLIIHGVLLILTGLLYLGMIAFATVMIQNDPQFQNGPKEMQAAMPWILGALYGSMGLAGLIPGVVQLFAGIRNLKFRKRGLGLTAFILGFIACATCYCGPTSIGLGIWGLIVYLNPGTKMAFVKGEQGYSSEDILTGRV